MFKIQVRKAKSYFVAIFGFQFIKLAFQFNAKAGLEDCTVFLPLSFQRTPESLIFTGLGQQEKIKQKLGNQ